MSLVEAMLDDELSDEQITDAILEKERKKWKRIMRKILEYGNGPSGQGENEYKRGRDVGIQDYKRYIREILKKEEEKRRKRKKRNDSHCIIVSIRNTQ